MKEIIGEKFLFLSVKLFWILVIVSCVDVGGF